MTGEKTFTLEEIRQKCLEYDRKRGSYPESQAEGFSVYTFIASEGDGCDEYPDLLSDAWVKEAWGK